MLMPRRLRAFFRRSRMLVALNHTLRWKIHSGRDWWGTKVWTRTTQVVTPLGFKFTSGAHPAYELMRTGKFEEVETALISALLPQIDVFVDVGANLGYYTCVALQQSKHVVAFEPQQHNLKCLFQNVASNNWSNLAEIFPLALSDRPGLLTLYGASGPSASLLKDWASYSSRFQQVVPVSTLDNVLAGRFSGKRLLVKIDVEGAEYRVLEGAIQTIARTPRPVWLLEVALEQFHPNGSNPDFERTFQLFWEHGYDAYTATSQPTLVTTDDVKSWVQANRAASGTFNYVFVQSGSILPQLRA
jgi:FkbM family methyltransferase